LSNNYKQKITPDPQTFVICNILKKGKKCIPGKKKTEDKHPNLRNLSTRFESGNPKKRKKIKKKETAKHIVFWTTNDKSPPSCLQTSSLNFLMFSLKIIVEG
jgi:hypothetical protein